MRMLFLGFLLIFSSCSQVAKKESSGSLKKGLQNISFDAESRTYENGLKVILIRNTKVPVFSYYTYYKVGGKYETKGLTGASHYLEHMMFKGAKKYKAGEFDRLVEGNGGSNNAYTTNDLTVYYENLPSEFIYKMLDIEADRMENLSLGKASFERERAVILEERKMRYENSDRGKMYLAMMKAMFAKTPYGTSVIGKISDLKSVTRDMIHDYFKKYYAPNNAVIVIAGDIDKNKVFDVINEKFGKIAKNKKLSALKEKVLKDRGGFSFQGRYNRWIKLHGTSPTPNFMYAFKGIKIGVRDAYVLDILSSILGDGGSSYLSQNFVLAKRPLLSQVHAANYTLQDSGVFYIAGSLKKKTNLAGLKKRLAKKIQNVCHDKNAINERNALKVKNQYLLDMISGLDTNAGVARFLGDRQVYYGDYKFYDKEFEIYNSVTVDELKKACVKYLKKKNALFLSIWNKHPAKK